MLGISSQIVKYALTDFEKWRTLSLVKSITACVLGDKSITSRDIEVDITTPAGQHKHLTD